MTRTKIFMTAVIAAMCFGSPAQAAPAIDAGNIANCPAFAPPGLDPGKCPALDGRLMPPPPPPGCPAYKGPLPPPSGPIFKKPAPRKESRVEAEMRRVAKALKQNKRSADALIAAARAAGAAPEVVADLARMSAAFRKVFMETVPPQQIVESMIAEPQRPNAGSSLIITAPDGSQWLVTPKHDIAQPPAGRQPVAPKGPVPPAERLNNPAFGLQPDSAQGPVAPKSRPAPPLKSEMIIMEQPNPGELPYWPTKQQLGKEGLLKYLEKLQEEGQRS